MQTQIKYCNYSKTIRIMPQNYCLLFNNNECWTLYFDRAINTDILHCTLDFLLIHENMFCKDGLKTANLLNEFLNNKLNK